MRNIVSIIASIGIAILTTAAGMYFELWTLTIAGSVLLVVALALSIYVYRKKTIMNEKLDEMGDENTIVGDTKNLGRVGSRNTIMNFADQNGNTVLNQSGITIGSGAGHDPSGIIIGAGAGANLGKLRKPKK